MIVLTFQCPDCGDYFPLLGIDRFFSHALRTHPDGIGGKLIEAVIEEVWSDQRGADAL